MKTTTEMIEVMCAFEEGKKIEFCDIDNRYDEWASCYSPAWDWNHYDYRINPEVKKETIDVNMTIETESVDISLRDYFAAKAMQGIIDVYYSDQSTSLTDAGVAEHSYRIADAMLEERKK